MPCTVGLRIDVDTLRGTRYGVPRLLETLGKHKVNASFFFCVGPDNMGRHVWRLLRPQFLVKMLRSNAASLYGWDILLRGTLWPGPQIGRRLEAVIADAARHGHEIGLHAWDHHAWQQHSAHWSVTKQRQQTQCGLDRLSEIVRHPVHCSAVAGWRCDQRTIEAKQALGLRYHSDCRGDRQFRPRLAGGVPGTPQVPVTLPTYDEVIGSTINNHNYNDYILAQIKPDRLNVYAVHAEVEGMALNDQFEQLLARAARQDIRFVPLGALLPKDLDSLPLDDITTAPIAGREGWVGWQSSALEGLR